MSSISKTKIILTLLFVLALRLPSAFSADFPFDFMPDKDTGRALSKTYGYVVGQNMSLEFIANKFPDLYIDCMIAQAEFDLQFGNSFENLQKILKEVFKDEWLNFDRSIKKNLTETLSKSNITKEYALDFINTVNERAKGQIESPVLETLLMCNPTFAKNPVEEIRSGFKKIFRTKGHEKSKELNVEIVYPTSWAIREGIRPNIIKFISANNGKGPANYSIMIIDFFSLPDKNEYIDEITKLDSIDVAKETASEIFSEQNLKAMATGTDIQNIRNINTKQIVLDRWPGAMIEFIGEQQRVDRKITSYFRIYYCLYKHYLITINCGIYKWPWDNREEFQKRINKYTPVFSNVAYNFVILSQY